MTQKWLISMLGAAALAVSGGAFAQTSTSAVPAFYVGAEVGSADVGDEDDIGYKILGGYQFHRNLAAEVAYGLLFDKSDVEVTGLEGHEAHVVARRGRSRRSRSLSHRARLHHRQHRRGAGREPRRPCQPRQRSSRSLCH